MERDRHDQNSCRQTRRRERAADRVTKSLRTGQKGAVPQLPAKPALRPVRFVYLGVMVLTWAGNWPLMKLALGQMPPFKFVLFRLIGSLILIGPVLLATGQKLLPTRRERLTRFWVGQLQVAGFLLCSIIGLAILPAGRAIVLAYTMPLWAIPIGFFLWPEPLDRAQLIGAAIGFAGLVLFMNPGLVDWGNGRTLAGNALLLLAAIVWALGSCLYRRYSWRSPFWVQTFWQLAVSVVPVGAMVLTEPSDGPVRWSPELVAILAYNWHRHDSPRLFSVGEGVVDDAGGNGRTSADADPDWRFPVVGADLQ